MLGLAAIYTLAAIAGLKLDAVSGFASLVWAPTGISLAVLLLAGVRVWPGVLLGAFTANFLTGAPAWVAIGIGVGNTLEGVVGAGLLRRIPGFRPSLDSLPDVVRFILIAALMSTTISATIGVSALYFGGLVTASNVVETWQTWWLGDAIGALVVSPVLMTWLTPSRLATGRVLETGAMVLALIFAGVIVFWLPAVDGMQPIVGAYVFFPLLMWAAIRFGQRGAATATLLVSAFAIAGTAMRHGPFIYPTTHASLFALQTFMGIMAATFLVLGASTAERDRSRDQLKTARDIATVANQAKSEFLAVMSHELRTPLNAIAGYSELLSMEVPGPLTDKQHELLARIQTSQEHLLGLINDVLDFAKIEAGATRIEVQSVSLCEILATVDAPLQPDFMRRQLTFVKTACDPSLFVRADPVKLRQILVNVLGNSVKFTPPNGRIEVSAFREQEKAKICVADTGVGIPAEMIERVFEPFVQVHAGNTRQYSGVGLGLAISRDFARAMGGEISIESEANRGCRVTIELALSKPID